MLSAVSKALVLGSPSSHLESEMIARDTTSFRSVIPKGDEKKFDDAKYKNIKCAMRESYDILYKQSRKPSSMSFKKKCLSRSLKNYLKSNIDSAIAVVEQFKPAVEFPDKKDYREFLKKSQYECIQRLFLGLIEALDVEECPLKAKETFINDGFNRILSIQESLSSQMAHYDRFGLDSNVPAFINRLKEYEKKAEPFISEPKTCGCF